jgi:zinc transport system permease protein
MENLTLPILAIIGISISVTLLGIFVLWNKMAYFGDALSHSSILGLALSAPFHYNPFLGLIMFAIFFAILINFVDKKNLYSKDTVIAIVSYSAVAIGLILIAIYPQNFDFENYLFGDLALVSEIEVVSIYLLAAIISFFILFYFKKLLLTTINKDLAIIEGIKVDNLKLKFSLILALFIAVSVKIIGIFLITALLILPAAIARNFSNSPIKMTLITLVIATISGIGGFFISLHFNLPASATIVGFLSAYFFIILLLKQTSKKSFDFCGGGKYNILCKEDQPSIFLKSINFTNPHDKQK